MNVSAPDYIIEASGVRQQLTVCLLRSAGAISFDLGFPEGAPREPSETH